MEDQKAYYRRMEPFIEDFGSMFENAGSQSISGRIMGWLMVCEPPHQSAAQLAELLNASKGSISAGTQLLITLGFVDKIKLPGDRKTYYRMQPNVWLNMARARELMRDRYIQIARKGLNLMKEKSLESKERLIEMEHLHVYSQSEIPKVLENWAGEWTKFKNSPAFEEYGSSEEE